MPDFNRDGRPDIPYYDNQLDSVTVDTGRGVLALRTTGGGGGGGDATAANQVLEINELTALNTSVGYDGVNSLNSLLFGISTTLGDDGAGSTNQILDDIKNYIGFNSGDTLNQLSVNANDVLSALFVGNIGSYEIEARTVSAGASIDISNTTLLAVVNPTTGHCVSVGSVFAIVTGITGIDNFNANYVQHNPSGAAQLFDFSRCAITGRTLDQQPSSSKVLSGNISVAPIIVVTIKNTRF